MNGLGNTAEGEVIVNLEWMVTSGEECTGQAELTHKGPVLGQSVVYSGG